MINEGRGISDVIKEDVDKIYQLFLDNSFSTHINLVKINWVSKT